MTVKIAQKLDDFDFTLDTKPLNKDNYEDYYVVTKEGRGEDPISRLIKKLRKLEDKDLKILFSGEREKEKIDQHDFDYSLNKLKNNYYNTIAYNEQTGLTAGDYYKILANCCISPDKKPEDVKGLMDLKHNLCILGYNGKEWYDVHPVVKELLKDKKLI
jgi:hypothetical protein